MRYRFFIVCGLVTIFLSSVCAQYSQQIPRSMIGGRRLAFPIRKKPTKEQKKQLSPTSEDLTRHARFLEQPKTGIFRLLPDLNCEENPLVIKADEECLNYIPESSFYSFREKEHTIELLSDIRLENDYFISDGILSQGIIVSLGDVPLDKVSLKSEGMDFLIKYSPNPSAKEAQKQYLELTKGIKSGKYVYRKIFPAQENTTYALRIVAYKGYAFRTFRGIRYNVLEGDKRIDLILAFRIISKGTDGGVTLLWKELNRKESPRIKLPKRKT